MTQEYLPNGNVYEPTYAVVGNRGSGSYTQVESCGSGGCGGECSRSYNVGGGV